MNGKSISLIGLGPMGQVMTHTLLKNGYQVTVWNRTAAKADALVEAGATKASSVEEVLGASEIILLSLTDYDVMYKILAPAAHALKGRILVNLSSDTPLQAKKAAAWAAGFGAQHLTGGVMVPPPMVGTPHSYVFYSGDKAVFEICQPILKVIGKPDYLGNDDGLAQLYYQALLDIMYFSLVGIVHALAMVRTANVTGESFEPYLNNFLPIIPQLVENIGSNIDERKFDGSLHNMHMLTASIGHVTQTSRDVNINSSLPAALHNIFERAVAAGHGNDGYASIVSILEKPAI